MSSPTEYQYETIQQFLLKMHNIVGEMGVCGETETIQNFLLGIHALVEIERTTRSPVKLSVAKILNEREASFAKKANRLMPKRNKS